MESTKDAIISAAIRLFSRKGFDQASMQDIAREAGIGKATIYFHFDSKDALIQAVYRHCLALSRAYLNAPLGDATLSGQLEARFSRMLSYRREHPMESAVENLYGSSPVYCHDPDIYSANAYHADILAAFQAAEARGEIHSDPVILANAYYGFIMQTYLMLRTNPQLDTEAFRSDCLAFIRTLVSGA